jgi:hypothetical protein
MRIRLCRSAHRFGVKRRYPTVANRLGSTAVISARRPYRAHRDCPDQHNESLLASTGPGSAKALRMTVADPGGDLPEHLGRLAAHCTAGSDQAAAQ